VSIAVQKATHEAYKNVFIVSIASGNTVPYPVVRKFKSAVVKLLPASSGTGMKAGSAVRSVLELA
jgi:small subunit ribosomal protein S5